MYHESHNPLQTLTTLHHPLHSHVQHLSPHLPQRIIEPTSFKWMCLQSQLPSPLTISLAQIHHRVTSSDKMQHSSDSSVHLQPRLQWILHCFFLPSQLQHKCPDDSVRSQTPTASTTQPTTQSSSA